MFTWLKKIYGAAKDLIVLVYEATIKKIPTAIETLKTKVLGFTSKLFIIGGIIELVNTLFAIFHEEEGKRLDHLKSIFGAIGTIIIGFALKCKKFILGIAGILVEVAAFFWDEFTVLTAGIISGLLNLYVKVSNWADNISYNVMDTFIKLYARIKSYFMAGSITKAIASKVYDILSGIEKKVKELLGSDVFKTILKLFGLSESSWKTTLSGFNNIKEQDQNALYNQLYSQMKSNFLDPLKGGVDGIMNSIDKWADGL